MYLHKEGKVAEYENIGRSGTCSRYQRVGTGSAGFPFDLVMYDSDKEPKRLTKEEALRAAMDYHETEGCALYLELYPAPEKGDYLFIAQDADGEWCGYDHKPDLKEDAWVERTSLDWHHICKSPPNPFWRKTLR